MSSFVSCFLVITPLSLHVTLDVFVLCGCLGAAEKNPKETQRLLDGAGVAAGDESRLL